MMENNKCIKKFKKCEVLGVYERKIYNVKNSWDYLIEVSADAGGSIPETANIKFMCYDVCREIKELVAGKRKKVSAAFGMADVDFFKDSDGYHITVSPSAGISERYYFDQDEFEKILYALE